VAAAASHFKNTTIADDFEKVTNNMDLALQRNDISFFKNSVTENHKLLAKIGVVPEKVQVFLNAIQQAGGAGKICGAGAVSGQKAGIVLVIIEDEIVLQQLCQHYEYSILPIKGVTRGVHVV
jgi:mevalonate kinase